MKTIKWHLKYWFLKMEAYWNAVDAYLAKQRRDYVFAADSECRQYECERKIILMELNRPERKAQ